MCSTSGRLAQRLERELEQQHRAADRALVGDAVGRRELPARRDLRRRGRRTTLSCGDLDRLVALADGVLDLEALGGAVRVLRAVPDLDEDGEPRLVGVSWPLGGGDPDEVGLVLLVGRVELARDLDLVLERADVEVGALGVGLGDGRPPCCRSAASGARAEQGDEGDEEGAEAARRSRAAGFYSARRDGRALAAPLALLEDRAQAAHGLAVLALEPARARRASRGGGRSGARARSRW